MRSGVTSISTSPETGSAAFEVAHTVRARRQDPTTAFFRSAVDLLRLPAPDNIEAPHLSQRAWLDANPDSVERLLLAVSRSSTLARGGWAMPRAAFDPQRTIAEVSDWSGQAQATAMLERTSEHSLEFSP